MKIVSQHDQTKELPKLLSKVAVMTKQDLEYYGGQLLKNSDNEPMESKISTKDMHQFYSEEEKSEVSHGLLQDESMQKLKLETTESQMD